MEALIAVLVCLLTITAVLAIHFRITALKLMEETDNKIEEVNGNSLGQALQIIRALNANVASVKLDTETLKKNLTELPRKTMRTLEGSTNVNKGAYAEWAAFHTLCREYDRVIFFNSVFDFLCIRHPSEEDPGTVDFVDVKSGRATLSKDQRVLRDLIKDKKIDFKTVRVKVTS